MSIYRVRLDAELITDWDSFHRLSKETFGFPDFYGMNMDAWIDCMSYLDEGVRMTNFVFSAGDRLDIEISASESLRDRLPEIYDALKESTDFVNQRYIDDGKQPVLNLIFL